MIGDAFERLAEVFEKAGELEGEARRRYLDEACGDDAALRSHVEKLLEKDDTSLLRLPDTPMPRPDWADGQQPRPPAIDGYEVGDPIGRGGMGVVWQAKQRSTGREVALKVVRTAGFGADFVHRQFQREVELAARLTHPNIARIYDCGVGDGFAYCAMELIDGGELGAYVAERKLSRMEIVALMRTVCRAVEHAHRNGVVHRDLKPSNILIAADGRPVLVDFGLAKGLQIDETERTITMPGMIAGTPAYMSPEQAAGDVRAIDTRTDIYSLGAILYRLLTGETPHGESGATLATIRRIAEHDVRRPRVVDPTLDADLEAILLKALARNPDERYAAAAILADDLDRYARGDAVIAHAATTWYLLCKWVRQRRLRVAIGGLFAVLLIASAVGFVVLTKQHEIEATELAEENDARRLAENAARLRAEGIAYVHTLQNALTDVEQHHYRRAELLLDTVPLEQRGWEWRHLAWRAAPNDDAEWVSERWGDTIRCVAFSPAGDRIAIAVGGQTDRAAVEPLVAIVDAATGNTLHRLVGHEDGVFAVAFTPDGREVLSGGRDRTLRRWDAVSGTLLETVSVPDSSEGGGDEGDGDGDGGGLMLFDVQFSPDGKRLAYAAYPKGLFIAETPASVSWRALCAAARNVVPLDGEYGDVKFRPDGRTLAWVTRQWRMARGHLCLVDVADGKELAHVVRGDGEPINAVDFSSDGSRLLCGADGGGVSLWRTDPLELVGEFPGHRGRVWCVGLIDRDRHAVSAGLDGLVRLWDVPKRQIASALYVAPDAHSTAMAISPKHDAIVAAHGPENRVRLWRVERALRGRLTVATHGAKARAAAISPGGKRVASVGDDGSVQVHDLATRDLIWSKREGPPFATAVVFGADGKRLYVGRSLHPDSKSEPPYGQIWAYDAETGDALARPLDVSGWVWDIVPDAAGKKAALALGTTPTETHARLGSGAVLDLDGWRVEREVSVAGPRCRAAVLSRDGTRLVTASEQQLAVWNLSRGEVEFKDIAKEGRNFVRLGDDGESVITGSEFVIEVRRFPSLELDGVYRPAGYESERFGFANVGDVAMTADRRRLISASWNGSITVWDTATGQAMLTFAAHDAGVHDLELSPDGETLISCGHDGMVKSWSTLGRSR